MRTTGLAWRAEWVSSPSRNVPPKVWEWWAVIVQSSDSPTADIRGNAGLCNALLQLSAAADEAASGFGVPAGEKFRTAQGRGDETTDVTRKISFYASRLLQLTATLCRQVHPSRLRVLPKLHVPQSGLTIRSISRNLALCQGDEIRPK